MIKYVISFVFHLSFVSLSEATELRSEDPFVLEEIEDSFVIESLAFINKDSAFSGTFLSFFFIKTEKSIFSSFEKGT
jgi:hypothetical protein